MTSNFPTSKMGSSPIPPTDPGHAARVAFQRHQNRVKAAAALGEQLFGQRLLAEPTLDPPAVAAWALAAGLAWVELCESHISPPSP